MREEILRFISNACVQTLKTQDLSAIAMDLIGFSHHCSRPNYWIYVVQILGWRPEMLLQKFWSSSLKKYINDFDGSLHKRKIIETFCMLHGEVVVRSIVEKFRRLTSKSELKTLSRDDYFVFRTPEGQLHDTSVLDT